MRIQDTREAPPEAAAEHVRRTELIISHTLRIGVGVSVALILLGMFTTFIRHPDYVSEPARLSTLTHLGASFPRTVGATAAGVAALRGQAIVVVGLLLLIATPIVRVAISILAFIQQNDKVYAGITTVVLILLGLSVLLGHASG